MSNAGFRQSAVIEWGHDACETFGENQRHRLGSVEQWPLRETDVRKFDDRGSLTARTASGNVSRWSE